MFTPGIALISLATSQYAAVNILKKKSSHALNLLLIDVCSSPVCFLNTSSKQLNVSVFSALEAHRVTCSAQTLGSILYNSLTI
jgi:hypothetical protein